MNERKSISYEARCLLDLLATIANQTKFPRWIAPPDWNQIHRFAEFHDVANVVYYASIVLLDKSYTSLREKFEASYRQAVLFEEQYSTQIPRLLRGFELKRVDCMLMHEYRMREFYWHADMRALKEVRLWVEQKNEIATDEVFKALGYEKKDTAVFQTHKETEYYKSPGVRVVVQWGLVFDSKKMQRYFEKPISSYPKEGAFQYVHRFSPEEFYIYVMANAAQRYATGTITLRDLVDIWCYYSNTYQELQFSQIYRAFQEMEIHTFHMKLMQLLSYWFGVGARPENNEIFVGMGLYIFSRGKHGRGTSYTILPLVKEVEHKYRKETKRKARNQSKTLNFPPREYMVGMFPSLEKTGVHLPLCWMIRLVRLQGLGKNKGNSKWSEYWERKAEVRNAKREATFLLETQKKNDETFLEVLQGATPRNAEHMMQEPIAMPLSRREQRKKEKLEKKRTKDYQEILLRQQKDNEKLRKQQAKLGAAQVPEAQPSEQKQKELDAFRAERLEEERLARERKFEAEKAKVFAQMQEAKQALPKQEAPKQASPQQVRPEQVRPEQVPPQNATLAPTSAKQGAEKRPVFERISSKQSLEQVSAEQAPQQTGNAKPAMFERIVTQQKPKEEKPKEVGGQAVREMVWKQADGQSAHDALQKEREQREAARVAERKKREEERLLARKLREQNRTQSLQQRMASQVEAVKSNEE